MDSDQKHSDRVTLFAFTYISHICNRRHKQMTFSGEHFIVLKGLNFQLEVGCNRYVRLGG